MIFSLNFTVKVVFFYLFGVTLKVFLYFWGEISLRGEYLSLKLLYIC